jgi:hypothetical protein
MSLTGLNEGDFTSINVLRSIGLGNRAGRGANNQVIKSDGTNANWGDIASSDIIQAGTGISIDTTSDPDTISTNVKSLTLSGTAVQSSPQTFNPNANGGTQTITINDTNDVYTGGDGIAISGSNEISADTDGTTTTNTGGSGSQIAVLKVPNSLTAGTNISFSTGSTYDGSTAITISSTDTNTEYTAGTGLSLSVGNEFSINLTEGTGITISGAEISLTSNTISGITLGNDLAELRITTGGGTNSYDGSSNLQINLDNNYTPLRIPQSSSGLPRGALFNNSGVASFVP